MMHRLEFRAMGCQMLAVVDTPEPKPPTPFELVPGWFEEWEQALSRFRADSELCLLNSHAGSSFQVSDVLWEVLQTSLDAECLTGGLVTPLVLDALVSAGYDRSFDLLFDSDFRSLPSPDLVMQRLTNGYMDSITRAITLPAGAHLDFGGVAKGWSAFQAMRRLSVDGRPVLVDAGGDITVSGPCQDGSSWAIGVTNPFNPDENLENLHLDRGGIATSGKDYRRWMRNDSLQHHIIDPRTGLPAETDILTATVIAPTVMQAEAMAKAMLISGSRSGMNLLESNPDLAGLLILENGQRIYSQTLQQYL